MFFPYHVSSESWESMGATYLILQTYGPDPVINGDMGPLQMFQMALYMGDWAGVKTPISGVVSILILLVRGPGCTISDRFHIQMVVTPKRGE